MSARAIHRVAFAAFCCLALMRYAAAPLRAQGGQSPASRQGTGTGSTMQETTKQTTSHKQKTRGNKDKPKPGSPSREDTIQAEGTNNNRSGQNGNASDTGGGNYPAGDLPAGESPR